MDAWMAVKPRSFAHGFKIHEETEIFNLIYPDDFLRRTQQRTK